MSTLKGVRSKYFVFTLVYIGYCICYIDRAAISLALTYIGAEFSLDATQLGLVVSVFFFSYALMQIPGGWLADRFGSNIVALIAILLWSVFTAMTGMAWSLVSLLFIRILFGIGEGAYPTASLKAVSEVFPQSQRPKAVTGMLSSNYVGSAIAPLVIAPLILAVGWRSTFYIIGVIGIVFAVFYYFWLRPMKQTTAAAQAKTKNSISYKELLKSTIIWQLVIICFGVSIVNKGLDSWMPTYLLNVRGVDLKAISILVPLPFIAAGLGAALSGWLMMKFFQQKEKYLLSIVSILTAVLIYGMYSSKTLTSVIIFQILVYFFKSIAFGSIFALLASFILPDKFGSASGIVNFGGQIAGFVAPLAIGFLIDLFNGSYNAAFIFLIAAVALSFIVSLTLRAVPKERKKRMLLQTQQLPNEIFHYMVNQIINGELPQGSRIRESDYAEKFSVSRSPVREALYRLEQEGIAVKVPRKGSFVKEFSAQDVYDIFEIRNNIEQMAIRRLNQNDISDYSFNSLQDELKQMKTVKNQVDYTQMNFNFHYHMICLTNSDVLKEFYLKLKYPLL
ncbi:MFS transporter, partial [Bacillales bacterium AN1005]